MRKLLTLPSGSVSVDDGGHGDAAPVVFLHSAAGDGAHFEALLAHLRPSRRAVAVDLRGHGASSAPRDSDYRIEAMAADVLAVIDALGLGRVVLAGHSMGGAVAVAAVGERPAAFAGLLLLDPASDGRDVPPEMAAGMLAALRDDATYLETIEAYWAPMIAPSSAEVRERLLRDLRATPRPAVIGPLEAMLSFDPVTPLAAFRGPRLSVITAFNDGPSALHAKVPEIRTARVEGTGHWLHLDRPGEVSAIVDAFLARVRD